MWSFDFHHSKFLHTLLLNLSIMSVTLSTRAEYQLFNTYINYFVGPVLSESEREIEHSCPPGPSASELDNEPKHSSPTGSIVDDFCNYMGAASLTNDKKMKAITDHFKPPMDYNFLTWPFWIQKCSFRFAWLEEYKWLVYSPTHDEAYCKYCVIFGHESNERNATKLDWLVRPPIEFWTTDSQKFKEHESKFQGHKTATLKPTTLWESCRTRHCQLTSS